jgi:hypothetical protein
MPRKRSAREESEISKPKQLRKRLRKAEDQLADAQLKRDRAQARLEALSIIADEIRAQLAEVEKAAEQDAAEMPEPGGGKPVADTKERSGRKPAPAGSPATEGTSAPGRHTAQGPTSDAAAAAQTAQKPSRPRRSPSASAPTTPRRSARRADGSAQ